MMVDGQPRDIQNGLYLEHLGLFAVDQHLWFEGMEDIGIGGEDMSS
jgi:hypothetical protein